MKRSLYALLVLLIAVTLMIGAGCKKKSTPIARAPVASTDEPSGPPPAVASPTVELNAAPTTIKRGEESNLSWKSTNADSIVIDNGVGNVATQGTVTVAPLESTTFTVTASNSGGQAKASARITVVRDEGPVEIIETDVQALQKAIDEGLVNPVYFAYDSAELSAEAKEILEENSKWFRRYPGARIIVEGHCDERGSEEYNLALGDRRSQSARDYLIQLGIPGDRLEGISYGEERPFVQGSNESAWSKNRRAHFVVR